MGRWKISTRLQWHFQYNPEAIIDLWDVESFTKDLCVDNNKNERKSGKQSSMFLLVLGETSVAAFNHAINSFSLYSTGSGLFPYIGYENISFTTYHGRKHLGCLCEKIFNEIQATIRTPRGQTDKSTETADLFMVQWQGNLHLLNTKI